MSTMIGERYQIIEKLSAGQALVALDTKTGEKVRLDMAPAGSPNDIAESYAQELIQRFNDLDPKLIRPNNFISLYKIVFWRIMYKF